MKKIIVPMIIAGSFAMARAEDQNADNLVHAQDYATSTEFVMAYLRDSKTLWKASSSWKKALQENPEDTKTKVRTRALIANKLDSTAGKEGGLACIERLLITRTIKGSSVVIADFAITSDAGNVTVQSDIHTYEVIQLDMKAKQERVEQLVSKMLEDKKDACTQCVYALLSIAAMDDKHAEVHVHSQCESTFAKEEFLKELEKEQVSADQ